MKTILEVVRDLIKPYIDKNASNIAPVEDSPVENPYYVGDQLIYKGVLYNVTADISIGDTLEIGTNISVAPKINSSVKSKLPSYSSDSTVWDTSPTASSTKPVTSGGVYTGLSGKAPTNHASTATTYGAGNASNYGHVKLNDSYTTSGGAASASVGASSKAVVDGYNALNGNKANQAVIATKQTNTTPVRKYEIGDQFIYNNTLYKADAIINTTDTISIGGNASVADNITTQISKIATLEGIPTATGVQYAWRMGRIVFFTFEVVLTNATTGTVICSGLPRPQGVVYCSFMTITNLAVPCIFDIDGKLKVYYPNSTISGRVDGSLMYFIYE